MLGRNSYPQDYIDACRARVEAQVAAYRAVAAAGKKAKAAPLTKALAGFEPEFFNNMVIVLDGLFMHRLRTMEGKDGNPLNEVRVLCTSMMDNDGRLAADKQITLKPESSVLGYDLGDQIRVDEAGFVRLADGFFAEIEKKYS
jgi:hypothetical protein